MKQATSQKTLKAEYKPGIVWIRKIRGCIKAIFPALIYYYSLILFLIISCATTLYPEYNTSKEFGAVDISQGLNSPIMCIGYLIFISIFYMYGSKKIYKFKDQFYFKNSFKSLKIKEFLIYTITLCLYMVITSIAYYHFIDKNLLYINIQSFFSGSSTIVAIPFIEGLLFLTIVYDNLKEANINPMAANIIQAILFSLTQITPSRIIVMLPIAFFLGYVKEKTNNIYIPIILFIIANLTSLITLLF